MGFIYENIGTIAVAIVVGLIIFGSIMKVVHDKKAGTSCSCGSGCSGCSAHGMCHALDEYEKEK